MGTSEIYLESVDHNKGIVLKKKHYISEPNCSNLIIGIEEVQLYVEPKIHSKEAGFHFHRWRIFFFCKMDGFYS